ncbi:Putative metal ion binding protein [Phytophthora palmivora]|uniref:Metal ion binding protein n=1 Tax=Phytophthora palmivora TaxID=4796 RepID=A0A2P4YPP2_9STRA|nr:Putative metal ion binding protein [Phytophthora palmivora]
MGSAQDEIRRLMKEAKQKPNATASRPKASSIKATPSIAKPVSQKSVQKPEIPVGFFDDSLADAKARNVDVQQLAEKQLESEWEAFQEFAAEVEQQSAKEEKEQVEETKEREAVEQLDNMQYVDRYRVTLERVTSLRNGDKTQKRKLEVTDVVEDETESTTTLEALKEYKKHRKQKRKQQSDSDDSEDFDPLNWRSRGI